MPAEQVLVELQASGDGLSSSQAALRRPAIAAAGRRIPRWLGELGESLVEPLQLLLLVVGVLSAVFGELRDAIAIFVVIAAVVIIETVTELRAERALAGLRALTAPVSRVRRDGRLCELPTAELVAGDVIEVEAGDLVPADARLLSAQELRVNEATLTGEAAAVDKHPDPVPSDAVLAERSSMLYAGTAVSSGEAVAVVTAAGDASELGQLGKLAATEREPVTPLQKSLRELARVVLIAAIAASVLVPVVGLLTGRPLKDMLLEGLTVAFATVPEELPILITVLLAVGGRQLARRGALLRRLKAGETIGAATVVVTDKTGTLTQNQLRLIQITGTAADVLTAALRTQPPARPGAAPSREPMEAELATAAERAGVEIVGEPIVSYPFDPVRKLVTRVWSSDHGVQIAVSGAPEAVLGRCDLTAAASDQAVQQLSELTGRGARVIGFARRHDAAAPASRDQAERQLEFLGFAAFEDPLRDGVGEAVAALRAACVQTIIVTGDHPDTAAAIARQAGLVAGPDVLHGDLSDIDDQMLTGRLHDGTVVARATPQGKLRLVRLLQARGEIVAVTGDGANDAPALAAADVGIAMGRRGADLARDAADIVLTDDAYPTVVAAIATGRNISAQLRRAVAFYLGAKLALVAALIIPLALHYQAPFAPVHIVLLELFMDLGASVAFVSEPAAPQAMHRPPRPPGARFLDRPEVAALLTVALTLGLAVVPVYLITLHTHDTATARSAAVLGWLAGHALIAWTLRTRPALSPRSNPAFPLWAATATAVGLLLTLTSLGHALHLSPLPALSLSIVCGGIAAAVAMATVARRVLDLSHRL